MSFGIDGLLEDAEAGAAEGVEEALALAPLARADGPAPTRGDFRKLLQRSGRRSNDLAGSR